MTGVVILSTIPRKASGRWGVVVVRAMSGHWLNPVLPAHRHHHHNTNRPATPPLPHETDAKPESRNEIVFVPCGNSTGTSLHKSCGEESAQACLPPIVDVYSWEAKQLCRHRVRFDDGLILCDWSSLNNDQFKKSLKSSSGLVPSGLGGAFPSTGVAFWAPYKFSNAGKTHKTRTK